MTAFHAFSPTEPGSEWLVTRRAFTLPVSRGPAAVKPLHDLVRPHTGPKVVEASTAAKGRSARLSAFNMRLTTDSRNLGAAPGTEVVASVESLYHGAKVLATGEHLVHLSSLRPNEAKKAARAFRSPLRGFRFDGHSWPLTPLTAFYDWLYLMAMQELVESSPAIGDIVRQADAFTDVWYDPDRGYACQARSLALWATLDRAGSVDEALDDTGKFIDLLTEHGYGVPR